MNSFGILLNSSWPNWNNYSKLSGYLRDTPSFRICQIISINLMSRDCGSQFSSETNAFSRKKVSVFFCFLGRGIILLKNFMDIKELEDVVLRSIDKTRRPLNSGIFSALQNNSRENFPRKT